MELPEEFGYEGEQRVCADCIPIIEGKTRGTGVWIFLGFFELF